MGVADNKTYKDQYHFNSKLYQLDADKVPSLEVEPKINTIIKENPYRANVEIEKGELVLEPDLTALYQARGKTHAKGGIEVMLKPDSFVFSNDPSLSIREDEHNVFELKKGGKKGRYKDTPASVLKRNIDNEHYNRMIEIINDPKKDDLSKKTASMMLDKYIQTLGRVAYLQEEKKAFPDGLPDFSLNAAPVFDSTLADEIDENKQYARYGGYIEMSPGGRWGVHKGDRGSAFKKKYGITNAADKITDLDAVSKQLGYSGPKNNLDFQKWLYGKSDDNKLLIDYWHNKYDDPNITRSRGARNRFDGIIGVRWQNAINDILRRPNPTPSGDSEGPIPTVELDIPSTTPPPAKTTASPPAVSTITGDPQNGVEIDWQFTPWQRMSHLYQGWKYANVQRHMPYRSHLNPSYMDPQLLNPEQAIGDMSGAYNTQVNAANTLNPILRNAQNASAYGQYLNQVPGVRSQYDNQNAQIVNSTRGANNQIRNNAAANNIQADQQYYQQAVAGRQNFENMRTYLGDQWMNNIMDDVATNQGLAYNLASVNNPAYGYNFRTGNFYRNNKNIMDVIGQQGTREDIIQLADDLRNRGYGEKLIGDIIRSRTFQSAQPRLPVAKKGGKVNPYK